MKYMKLKNQKNIENLNMIIIITIKKYLLNLKEKIEYLYQEMKNKINLMEIIIY